MNPSREAKFLSLVAKWLAVLELRIRVRPLGGHHCDPVRLDARSRNQEARRALAFKGRIVVKLVDGELTDSWLQRARAEGTPDVAVGAESNSAARALAASAAGGWDPWEAWLRHIDQPRRRLVGRRLKSPD